MTVINYDVPFVPDSETDTHCYQACLSMIIQFFKPEFKPTLDELDLKMVLNIFAKNMAMRLHNGKMKIMILNPIWKK